MSDLYKQQYDQMRALPGKIEATERKLLGFYRQAARYGMDRLLTDKSLINEAWDRETMLAYLEHQEADRAA